MHLVCALWDTESTLPSTLPIGLPAAESPAGGGTGMRVSEESPVCCGFSQSSGQRHQAQPTCGAVRKQKAIGPSLTPGKFYGFKSTL